MEERVCREATPEVYSNKEREYELRAVRMRRAGFSLLELLAALVVAMILVAVGLPMFLRAYHSYQLSNAARQVRDVLLLTRYEAIRLNRNVNCIIGPSGSNPGMTNLWVDSNGNNTLDPAEKMVLLGNGGNLVDAGTVPATPTLFAKAVNSYATVSWPSFSTVQFDARGAVKPPTSVVVFCLSSAIGPEAGYRAVLLMPAGSMQVWTADASGNWQQLQ